MSPGPRFPLLEARSWQEAKSNLVTVALGKDDRIASCWTLGPPVFRISPKPGTKSVKENATKQPAFANPETVFVRK
ncbi:unnamed protein product [Brassica rapa]|uniref:Uncharacterized protein n=1 Tax=Brassica campestris TaxID=3711 RepID=A0A8D9DF62_BRACM|nr:unnamed protein product [Brassica rapa]